MHGLSSHLVLQTDGIITLHDSDGVVYKSLVECKLVLSEYGGRNLTVLRERVLKAAVDVSDIDHTEDCVPTWMPPSHYHQCAAQAGAAGIDRVLYLTWNPSANVVRVKRLCFAQHLRAEYLSAVDGPAALAQEISVMPLQQRLDMLAAEPHEQLALLAWEALDSSGSTGVSPLLTVLNTGSTQRLRDSSAHCRRIWLHPGNSTAAAGMMAGLALAGCSLSARLCRTLLDEHLYNKCGVKATPSSRSRFWRPKYIKLTAPRQRAGLRRAAMSSSTKNKNMKPLVDSTPARLNSRGKPCAPRQWTNSWATPPQEKVAREDPGLMNVSVNLHTLLLVHSHTLLLLWCCAGSLAL